MHILVYNGEIAGTTDRPNGLPNGFTVYEVPAAPLDNYYYDGNTVVEKPIRPDPEHVWRKNKWVKPKQQEQQEEMPLISDDDLEALLTTQPEKLATYLLYQRNVYGGNIKAAKKYYKLLTRAKQEVPSEVPIEASKVPQVSAKVNKS